MVRFGSAAGGSGTAAAASSGGAVAAPPWAAAAAPGRAAPAPAPPAARSAAPARRAAARRRYARLAPAARGNRTAASHAPAVPVRVARAGRWRGGGGRLAELTPNMPLTSIRGVRAHAGLRSHETRHPPTRRVSRRPTGRRIARRGQCPLRYRIASTMQRCGRLHFVSTAAGGSVCHAQRRRRAWPLRSIHAVHGAAAAGVPWVDGSPT